jgi:hypothetical protein
MDPGKRKSADFERVSQIGHTLRRFARPISLAARMTAWEPAGKVISPWEREHLLLHV